MQPRSEAGDSLIEIIFAIVVIGLVVSAVIGAITTSENGTRTHRELVIADSMLRNYAETVKGAVRTACPAGGTWTATYPPPIPTGYSINALSGQSCPAVTTTAPVQLQVRTPGGVTKSLYIAVRTP